MFRHKSRMAICLLVLLASNIISITNVSAQTPNAPTHISNAPTQTFNTPAQFSVSQPASPSPNSVRLPDSRVGVEPGKFVNLSLRDTVVMAIEHNLDVQLEKTRIKIIGDNLRAAQGAFDLVIHANFNYSVEVSPVTSILIRSILAPGQLSDINVTRNIYKYDGELLRRYRSGGLLNVQFDNRRLRTDEGIATLGLEYRSKALVTFTQPLLKNFLINESEHRSRSLKKQLDLSDLAFRQKLIDLIARTQAAYYDLAFAIKSEEILRESVALADAQLKLVELQVQAGKVAAAEVASAQAELLLRQDDAIAAQLVITRAENQLKNLILDSPDSEIWRSRIIPIEPIEFNPQPIDLQRAIDTAMTQRPELKQLETQSEINKLDLRFFKNQKRPQVDVFGSFIAQNIIGERNTNRPPVEFIGNYFEGILGIYKFRSYVVGAEFSYPIGNHSARANIASTLVAVRQVDTRRRKLTQLITSEVINAIATIEAAAKRVTASHAAVVNAETQLKVEQQRFEVGFSTNVLVLQRQNSLSLARGRELRAKTDYIEARAELQRVMADNIP